MLTRCIFPLFSEISPQQIFRYIENTGSQHEQEVASDIILRVVDVIMQNKLSLNNQQVGRRGTATITEAFFFSTTNFPCWFLSDFPAPEFVCLCCFSWSVGAVCQYTNCAVGFQQTRLIANELLDLFGLMLGFEVWFVALLNSRDDWCCYFNLFFNLQQNHGNSN